MTSKNERDEGMGPMQRAAQEKVESISRMQSVKRRPGESRASHERRVKAAANGEERAENTGPLDEDLEEQTLQRIEYALGARSSPPDDLEDAQHNLSPADDEQLAARVADGVEQELGIAASDDNSSDGESSSGDSNDDPDDTERVVREVERQFGAPNDEGGGDKDDEGDEDESPEPPPAA